MKKQGGKLKWVINLNRDILECKLDFTCENIAEKGI